MSRPIRTLQTAVIGFTIYPFANRSSGLDVRSPAAGQVCPVGGDLGFVRLACSRAARRLLILQVTSLIPFAFTWRLLRDRRSLAAALAMALAGVVLIFIELPTLVPSERSGAVSRTRSRPATTTDSSSPRESITETGAR